MVLPQSTVMNPGPQSCRQRLKELRNAEERRLDLIEV